MYLVYIHSQTCIYMSTFFPTKYKLKISAERVEYNFRRRFSGCSSFSITRGGRRSIPKFYFYMKEEPQRSSSYFVKESGASLRLATSLLGARKLFHETSPGVKENTQLHVRPENFARYDKHEQQ